MQIKYKDSPIVFTELSYVSDDGSFVLQDTEHSSTLVYTPVLKLDNEYNVDNFTCLVLNNENAACTENSIFQLYVKDQRIGWIFPIQSLLSSDHDCAQNKYFLKYAYVATYLLLRDIECLDKLLTPSYIDLDKFYESKKCICVIDHENTAKIEDFDIENYVVSLFKHGYSFFGRGNLLADMPAGGVNKRLQLTPISKDLCKNPYINHLFKAQFPNADNPLVCFHLCYQIIELLISVVFDNKLKTIVEKLEKQPESLFDLREELNEMVGEKKRVNWLFSQYVRISSTVELKLACEKLLNANQKAISPSYSDDLYSVRCLLVHKLYSITKESYKILEELNKVLLPIVIEMLCSFQIPS